MNQQEYKQPLLDRIQSINKFYTDLSIQYHSKPHTKSHLRKIAKSLKITKINKRLPIEIESIIEDSLKQIFSDLEEAFSFLSTCNLDDDIIKEKTFQFHNTYFAVLSPVLLLDLKLKYNNTRRDEWIQIYHTNIYNYCAEYQIWEEAYPYHDRFMNIEWIQQLVIEGLIIDFLVDYRIIYEKEHRMPLSEVKRLFDELDQLANENQIIINQISEIERNILIPEIPESELFAKSLTQYHQLILTNLPRTIQINKLIDRIEQIIFIEFLIDSYSDLERYRSKIYKSETQSRLLFSRYSSDELENISDWIEIINHTRYYRHWKEKKYSKNNPLWNINISFDLIPSIMNKYINNIDNSNYTQTKIKQILEDRSHSQPIQFNHVDHYFFCNFSSQPIFYYKYDNKSFRIRIDNIDEIFIHTKQQITKNTFNNRKKKIFNFQQKILNYPSKSEIRSLIKILSNPNDLFNTCNYYYSNNAFTHTLGLLYNIINTNQKIIDEGQELQCKRLILQYFIFHNKKRHRLEYSHRLLEEFIRLMSQEETYHIDIHQDLSKQKQKQKQKQNLAFYFHFSKTININYTQSYDFHSRSTTSDLERIISRLLFVELIIHNCLHKSHIILRKINDEKILITIEGKQPYEFNLRYLTTDKTD